ncbi:MAG: putative peroxidase-related enzyme [Arenicella sp.]|jgi:uncharacterized peroxidase-related enzyme
MSVIEIIEPEQAEGELKAIYDELVRSRGKVAEVHKIQSLNPKTITSHMDLYMSVMFGQSPLKRVHREMMAVVVSVSNRCEYCTIHHLEAVQNYWKDEERLATLKHDFTTCQLTDKEMALCEYARDLTIAPYKSSEQEYAAKLRKAGFTDREILDATLVVSYFNFVNRIVLSLGVELEETPGGYKY